MNRLILVAAPSCCGKTVFIACLKSGALPLIAQALGLGDIADWRFCDAARLPEVREEHVDRLMVAYALPAQELTTGASFEPSDDPRLGIVSLAREVALVTLLAGSVTLASRLQERLWQTLRWALTKPTVFFRAWMRLRALLPLYRDPVMVRTMYEWWFQYARSVRASGAWVVNAEMEYALQDAAAWTQASISPQTAHLELKPPPPIHAPRAPPPQPGA